MFSVRRGQVGDENARLELESVHVSSLKARVALVEQKTAATTFQNLSRENDALPQPALENPKSSEHITQPTLDLVTWHTGAIVKLQNELIRIKDPARQQAYVLQRSTQVLHQLLAHWTNLEPDEEDQGNRPLDTRTNATKVSTNTHRRVKRTTNLTKCCPNAPGRGAGRSFI